ncbi:hypothetical protein BOX15_Mlig004182g2, partial [Macrostomum lignano]
ADPSTGEESVPDSSPAIADRVSVWNSRSHAAFAEQARNPFSSRFAAIESSSSAAGRRRDPGYGKPPEGSRTEARGFAAHDRISAEITELCELIKQIGRRVVLSDGKQTWQTTFGELFSVYERISNKVVGVLLRARKHGLVDFQGEMLFQGRDAAVAVTLLKDPTDDGQLLLRPCDMHRAD